MQKFLVGVMIKVYYTFVSLFKNIRWWTALVYSMSKVKQFHQAQ